MAKAPSSWWSLALGAFVIWQVIYLPLANAIQVLPRERNSEKGDVVIDVQEVGQFTSVKPVQGAINLAGTFVDRWSEVTGQQQNFKMFCPKLPDLTLFPIVVLTFANGSTQRIESSFADFETPIRWPLLSVREHHRESNTIALVWHLTSAEFDRDPVKSFRDYQFLANARIRTARSLIERLAHSNRCNGQRAITAELILQFVTKSPAPLAFEERPFLRFDLSRDHVEIFNPTRLEYEALAHE